MNHDKIREKRGHYHLGFRDHSSNGKEQQETTKANHQESIKNQIATTKTTHYEQRVYYG